MRKISITLAILILGLSYGIQDNGLTQIIAPEFGGADLSIPKSINFQGYLYRDGNPIDTTMNMWFGIYDNPSSGTQLFQQTINNVIVTKGWFTVTLDNLPNSVFPVGGPTRYLDVKAPSTGPSLSPRISLVSVGYSYHAITADSAEYAKAAPLSRPITPQIYSTEIRDTTIIDAKLKDGSVTMAKINQASATTGQVIKWTGSAWAPRNDSAGGPPSGAAGGDLTGTYPNPSIASNAVNSTKILDGTIKGVDIAKPCTLEASIVYPNALLVAKNNGNGNGIEVTKIGTDGFRVVRAGDDGVQVDSARYGYSLYRAANDGLWIARAGNNGIYIDSAGQAGIKVVWSDYNGVDIDSVDWMGVSVGKARFGVGIGNMIQDAIGVSSAGNYGVYIGGTGADGFRVSFPDQDGFSVDSAGENGVEVEHARYHGIQIGNAGWDGLNIGSVVLHGVYIEHSDNQGLHISSTGSDGIVVWRSGRDGIAVDSAAHYGVYAVSGGSAPHAGVYGEGPTSSVGAYGVYGYARNKGVYGQSNFWEGVYGDANADDAVEGYYSGNTAFYAGVHGRRADFGYGVYYEGGLGGSGTKSAIVRTSKGPVALYCQESPENWFEDFGEGKLINGHCRIELDKLFLETVTINDHYPIKVFVQLTSGDPMNLVVKKDLNGFDLIAEDLTSNATFDYRIVAKRKGFEDLRLKPEEIGYTDQQLYPDLNDPKIPAQIRAKRLEEIENRKKEDEMRKNNQLEKTRREERQLRLEKK